MTTELPALQDLLGEDSYRLHGIPDWESVPELGDANLARMEALVEKFIYRSMSRGEDVDELKVLARGKRHLIKLREQITTRKPYLPRLRNELFREGDTLMLYLGDTPSARGDAWRRVEVTKVEKGHNSEWSMDSSARGYYWRVTVKDPDKALLPGHQQLSFSTTEPRAILEAEFDYLQQARESDPLFFQVFCANARRDWKPIWCLELGLECDTEAMDMSRWLAQA
jgi:hypothetical protein